MRKFAVLSALLLMVGCATTHTAQFDTQPMRQVSALVVYDSSYALRDIAECVSEASYKFETEFGIIIVPKEMRPYAWTYSDNTDILLDQMAKLNQDNQYDMVIGFTRRTALHFVVDNLVAGWSGVVDDIWRRYVVVKSTDDYILTHELVHAFVFTFGHEWSFGQLSAVQVGLIPFIPITLRSSAISDAVYREVMRNKWRDFSQQVSYH